jgi:hypothetical protein
LLQQTAIADHISGEDGSEAALHCICPGSNDATIAKS